MKAQTLWKVRGVIMNFLDTYTERLRVAGKTALAQSIEMTVARFCGEFLDGFDYCSATSALLVGNVQSGKTGQMLGIISAAADRDFFVFVILTTDNVLLQQQTLSRVKNDLPDFCVCGEDDSVLFEVNDGVKPAVIVLKKNARTLRRWEKTFLTSRILVGNPLFILDDEADAASLNAKVNQADISAINKCIGNIRRNASSSIYLEVTGTPQSIFLQTAVSGWRPRYVLAFEPGAGYLGGDFFFSVRGPVPRCIGFTDSDPDPIKTFVVRHLVVSAVSFMQGETVSNALAHVSAQTQAHEETAEAIRQTLSKLDGHLLDESVNTAVADLEAATSDTYDRKSIQTFIRTQLLPNVRVIIKNSKSKDEAVFNSGCCFIVGGNALGRGVTFPRLNTVLYTRLSKQPQADTIWQHNRIFGYDRDPQLICIYLTRHLWKLLCSINEQNNSIYTQIRAGFSRVKISFPPGISPTRRNVLDNGELALLSGGLNRYPDALRNRRTRDIDALLKDLPDSGAQAYPLTFAQEILRHIVSDDEDFLVDAYNGIFCELLTENPDAVAVFIVRRGRHVAQGTGALLSPNDWKLTEGFPGKTIIVLYRIEGDFGWSEDPIWVPSIRLPENRVFFVMRK